MVLASSSNFIYMKRIISALIPCSKDRDEYLSTSSCIRYFKSRVRKEDIPEEYSFIAKVAMNYFESSNGGLLDSSVFEVLVQNAKIEDSEKVRNLALFSNFSREHIDYDKFQFHLDHFIEQKEAEWIAEQQTLAMTALEQGFTDPSNKIRYQGPEGARLILQKIIYENPYRKILRTNPEGDIRNDAEDVLEDYDNKKKGLVGTNEIFTGIDRIDEATGGFKRSDLILIGAATGEGKSILAANIAHHNCIKGKNGVIFTAETSRKVYRRRILARHSCEPTIGRPTGLDSNKIRDGLLEKDEEVIFLRVLKDFTENPEYGYLNIVQVSRGDTVRSIFDKLEEIQRQVPLDYVIIDYLELLSPGRRRQQRREEIEEMLLESKEMALTFDNGRGIVVIDLHQMKIDARSKVKPEDDKFYTIRDFGHTSEAGKSADVAVGLLYTDELRDAHELACKLLKVRDGDLPPMFKLFERFSSSYVGNLG